MTPAGLPHSDTPGSQLGCQLPRAYRRLLRPSSALDAKASTMCPSQLVSQTQQDNGCKRTTKMLASTIQISSNNPTDLELATAIGGRGPEMEPCGSAAPAGA